MIVDSIASHVIKGSFTEVPPTERETKRRRAWREISGSVAIYQACDKCGLWFDDDSPKLRSTRCIDCCRQDCASCNNSACASRSAEYQQREKVILEIPPEYAMADLESIEYQEPEYKAMMKAWPNEKLLLISGVIGSGKTYALYALARRAAASGMYVRFEKAESLHDKWRKSLAFSSKDSMDPIVHASRLILDEFGQPTEPAKGWVDFIKDMLDYRMANKLPTALATMHKGTAIQQIMGPAVLSRVISGNIVKLKERDRRRTA